jgi:hypothetical protein
MSSFCYICVLIRSAGMYISYICVNILLCIYVCPHSAIYVSSSAPPVCIYHIYVSSFCYVCVLLRSAGICISIHILYMCPHCAMYVSSCYVCVLMLLLHMWYIYIYIISVYSYYYICVLMLLDMRSAAVSTARTSYFNF